MVGKKAVDADAGKAALEAGTCANQALVTTMRAYADAAFAQQDVE